MENRFRFRFWLEEEHRWFYFGFETFLTYQKQIEKALDDGLKIYQSTELKDKNGKLIYEGDMVDVLPEIDEIAIIEWDNEEAKFIINHYFEKYISTFENYYGKDLEVIGNIYENAGLLKEGKE